jgi:hypothetical protein
MLPLYCLGGGEFDTSPIIEVLDDAPTSLRKPIVKKSLSASSNIYKYFLLFHFFFKKKKRHFKNFVKAIFLSRFQDLRIKKKVLKFFCLHHFHGLGSPTINFFRIVDYQIT